ncbi:MAG: hypothetical protein IKB64_06920 [Paludibacteraceae bacterium]|nr:hypothetical protein [Paludibacteraceae bacterium]MBR6686271.1 hypothetical protein [Paludibacteraceae bacterium]
MKYYLLLFCMFLSGVIAIAQTDEEYEDMDDYEEPDWNRTEWKGAFDYSYDSIEEAEWILIVTRHLEKSKYRYLDAFVDLLSKEPKTIDYPFEKYKKQADVIIKTASDGRFRSYSWDNFTGGTMIFYTNVYQYYSGDSVYTMVGSLRNKLFATYRVSDSEPDPGEMVVGIYSIECENRSLYLVEVVNKLWSFHFANSLMAIEVKNDSIVPSNLFVGLSNQLEGYEFSDSELRVKYRYSESEGDSYRLENAPDFISPYGRLVKYDSQNRILYVAQVDKIESEGESESVLNGSLIRFYFNGECFEMLK